jgi:hypothetical protein
VEFVKANEAVGDGKSPSTIRSSNSQTLRASELPLPRWRSERMTASSMCGSLERSRRNISVKEYRKNVYV